MATTRHVELRPTSTAPTQARGELRRLVAPGDPPWLGDAELVVSELVANAVEHGDGTLSVFLEVDHDRVRIAVTTGATDAVPAVLDVGPDAPHGRGLRIVSAVAQHWGHEVRGGRRTVWAVLVESGAER